MKDANTVSILNVSFGVRVLLCLSLRNLDATDGQWLPIIGLTCGALGQVDSRRAILLEILVLWVSGEA